MARTLGSCICITRFPKEKKAGLQKWEKGALRIKMYYFLVTK